MSINNGDSEACNAGEAMDDIVKRINTEITNACMIPLTIPKKATIQIVKEAKKWMFKNYEDSVHENYHVLHHDLFTTDEFATSRSLKLPTEGADGGGRIFSVNDLAVAGEQLIGLSGKTGFVDSDFSVERVILGGAYGTSGINSTGESLLNYVVLEKYFDMARQILINKISFKYNRLSQKLTILGETPNNHVILQVFETIDDCSLYSDEVFLRYAVAKAKMQLGTMIMTFGYNMPGNVTLNGDMIRDAGKEELDEIKEEIKGDEGVDYIMHS